MAAELPTYARPRPARAFGRLVGEALDRFLPPQADAVIVFDGDHKALHELYGIADRNIFVVPPGLHGPEIRGATGPMVEHLRAQLGQGPWILYAGNPDNYQNLPLLWSAFARVRAARPDVGLLIATHHSRASFSPPAMPGIVFHRFSSLDELRGLFALASVGVCTRVMWTGAPIKILNYIAAGLPVVACRSAVRHLLNPAAGLAVDDDPEAFSAAILKIIARGASYKIPRRAFDRFRIEGQVPLYENIYRSLGLLSDAESRLWGLRAPA